MLPLTLALFALAGADPREDELYKYLMKSYNPLERPVDNNSYPVKVTLGISLQQIVDLVTDSDEKNQILRLNAWLNYAWNDYKLVWEPKEFGGVGDVRFPFGQIWRPDVLLYNSVDSSFDSTFPTNMVVYSDGTVNWIPPGIFQIACKIEITWFPFDDQACFLKFGSWTYDGNKLDLQESGMDMSDYITNGEWKILGTPVSRNIKYYDCCPEPYPDLKFYIKMRRRTLYYGLNLIFPSLLISLMTILVFTLPPDAGEKIGFEITILLSMCFFLGIVSNMTPPTSEAVPLIGAFFTTCMLFVAISVVSTVLVLNLHHRQSEMYEMSHFANAILLHWLPWLMWMHRPGHTFRYKSLPNPFRQSKNTDSQSLMRNVRCIEDDTGGEITQPRLNSMELDHKIMASLKKAHNREDVSSELSILMLHRIYKEIKFMTRRMAEEDKNVDCIHDFNFAAMVVDRLCLILFSIFMVGSSAGILFSAPYIIA